VLRRLDWGRAEIFDTTAGVRALAFRRDSAAPYRQQDGVYVVDP
jgi:hypothetical protein